MLENACHELDLAAADVTGSLGGASFDKYTSALKRYFALKDELEKQIHVVNLLDQLITYLALTLPEGSPALEEVKKETTTQRHAAQALVKFKQYKDYQLKCESSLIGIPGQGLEGDHQQGVQH